MSRWRHAPVVYCAGPYRHATAFGRMQNIARAHALGLEVWKVGAVAMVPHSNTANYDGELPDEAYLDGDLAILERCDAVMLTPDWQRSSGARAEVEFAKALGLPIFESLGVLEYWIDGYCQQAAGRRQ